MLNLILKKIIKIVLHILWLLPVKHNQLMFISFQGSTMGCSPYYIYKELIKEFPNMNYIWCFNKKTPNSKNIKYVVQGSLPYIFYIMTSKIIINNSSCPTWIPYRKKQIIINTWHGGGAYKKVATDELKTKAIISKEKQSAKDTTFFISSCQKFTEVMTKATFVPEEKFLNIGMPRNDIFFDKELLNDTNKIVREKLNMSQNDLIVLYAPTYRGSSLNASDFSSQLNVELLRKSLKERFNKNVVILFRGHYFFLTDGSINIFDINVSDYPIMQELLCAADILVTDYSSCMWDFALTKKLCVLFAPDIDEYIEQRGFYTEPSNWGFPIAKTNEELYSIVNTLDLQDYEKKIEESYNYFGSFEQGDATKNIITIIKNYI